jgi:hypothetical protein
MQANLDPKPIKALGRFTHESVAVDPFLDRTETYSRTRLPLRSTSIVVVPPPACSS